MTWECKPDKAEPPWYLKVQGYCPMGCGETLEVNKRGAVSCGGGDCMDPHAVQEILNQSEHRHILNIDTAGWTLKHPLAERVQDELFECPIGARMHVVALDRVEHGRYAVSLDDDQWKWEKL